MGRKTSDLTGGHYGRWTVLRKSKIKKHGSVCYDCYCDPERGGCGFRTPPDDPVNGASLRSGHSLSCGCLKGEKVSKASTNRTDKDRNAAVFSWVSYGIPRTEVAKKFKLSKQRVHQIIHREKESLYESIPIRFRD